MVKPKGLFVTFDGPNGVGKSSILQGVANRLIQLDVDILETKEPTLSPLGQFVRNAEEVYKGRILACIVVADRYFHLEHEVLPALSVGKVVLSDRYIESSLVLQRLDGVEVEFIWSLNSKMYIPDLSVILTAPAEILEKRLAQRGLLKRFERTKSRATELEYYIEAAEFLSKYGFNILLLENSFNPPDENINRILEQILFLINTKKPHLLPQKRGGQ